jgi:hypothetical protein
VCAGLITLLVIIYKGHSPSLVRARSQEKLEVVFASALCNTSLTDHHHRSDRWTLSAQVFGDEKFKSVISPIHPPLRDIKVLSTRNVQHYTHTPTVQQVQKSVNMYQGQTNMVSSADYYGTPHTSNFTNIQQGVSSMHSLARNSMYMIMPQNLPVNEKVSYTNSSHPTSYSQTSCATNLYKFSKVEMNQFLSI